MTRPLNWLQTDPADRPDLPTREVPGSTLEVQCPVCGQWRPGFVLFKFDAPAAATRFGHEWGCDNERSILAREAAAAVEAAMPPPERRLTKTEFLDLWTPAETVAVMQSADPGMAFFWARCIAWDGYFLLSDSRVIAGATLAVQLEILTEARAARILAGLPPE